MQEHTPGQFSQRVIERAREANTPTPSSIGGQIAKRPWLSVGLALAAGYMLGGRSEPRASWSPERAEGSFREYTPPAAGQAKPAKQRPEGALAGTGMHYYATSPDEAGPAERHASGAGITHYPGGTPAGAFEQPGDGTSRTRAASAGLGHIASQVSGEVDTLKSAAVGAVIDLLRGVVAQNLPAVSREMDRMRSERQQGAPKPGAALGETHASPTDAPTGAVFTAPQARADM